MIGCAKVRTINVTVILPSQEKGNAMEKKLLFKNPDQWIYVFGEMSLADLLQPAGEITLHAVEYRSEVTRFPLTVRLKRKIRFGNYENAVRSGVLVNSYTHYVSTISYGFLGSRLSELPHEGTEEILLELPLHLDVAEDETLTEQQVQDIYHDFARRLLGLWYIDEAV